MNSIKVINKLNKNSLRCITTNLMRNQSSDSSSTNQPLVLTEVNDKTGFATLSLNRPPMGNFTLELLHDFSKALDNVETKKYKGMILTSVNKIHHKFTFPSD